MAKKKMKINKWIWILIAIIIVVGGYLLIRSGNIPQPPALPAQLLISFKNFKFFQSLR